MAALWRCPDMLYRLDGWFHWSMAADGQTVSSDLLRMDIKWWTQGRSSGIDWCVHKGVIEESSTTDVRGFNTFFQIVFVHFVTNQTIHFSCPYFHIALPSTKPRLE
jgi:hypothetical protein